MFSIGVHPRSSAASHVLVFFQPPVRQRDGAAWFRPDVSCLARPFRFTGRLQQRFRTNLPTNSSEAPYLKTFLVWRQVEFPKTHSIGQLLDLVSAVAPELAASLAEVISLTPFGAEIRYPGDFPELLPGEERTFFELAMRTREAILAQLEPHLSKRG